ncbi:MAG: hypothetical protein ABI972_21330 [Acidobacteriota bacterium]
MSQPYNPRVVAEKTPNALLEKFLSPYKSFLDLDWTKLPETDAEAILQRVRVADESDRRLIGVRFRQVHALANSRGTAVLIAASGDQCPEFAKQLAARKNAYERAFWCLVEHPKLFDSELVYAHTYSLGKTSRETRVGFPEGKVVITEAMINNLREHIQATFKPEERAKKCKIDHREQDGVHLLHSYPSDYSDEIDSYGPDDQLVGVSVVPPFPVVYYLDETTGSVTVLTKGGAHKIEALFDGFGNAVFDSPAPPKAGKKTYDLSLFKDPNFEHKTDPAHQLRSLRVTAMKIHFPGRPRRRARFEVNPNEPHDDLYALLRSELRGGLDKLVRSTILSVDLQAVFGGPGGKEEVVEFSISAPRWCTLGHDGKEGVLRRYLRPWGIENDGKRVAALPKAARVG